jgi:hypothetical protein
MWRALEMISALGCRNFTDTLDRLFIIVESLEPCDDPVQAIKDRHDVISAEWGDDDEIMGQTIAELFESEMMNGSRGRDFIVGGKYIFPAVYPNATIKLNVDVTGLDMDMERGRIGGFMHAIRLWILQEKHAVIVDPGIA